MAIFMKYPPGTPAMLDVVTVKGVTQLSGIASPNTSVSVFDGNNLVGTVTAAADGTWTLNTKLTGSDVHSFYEISANGFGSTQSAGVTVYSLSANKTLQGSGGNDFLIGGDNATQEVPPNSCSTHILGRTQLRTFIRPARSVPAQVVPMT
jgi:hypothetical protein